MADKLSLYNGALRLLGERTLSGLTEDRESRRVLDSVWYGNTAIRFCLEQGQWNFATRAVAIPYAPAVTPAFGYKRAFEKPDDFIRTTHFCWDEHFKTPLTDYIDVTGYWYAEPDEVYVRYVSMDTDTGLDLSLWPESFSKYVEAYLADEIAPRITESQSRVDRVRSELENRLKVARSRDAMEAPQQRLPEGSWTASRGYGYNSRTRRFTGNVF